MKDISQYEFITWITNKGYAGREPGLFQYLSVSIPLPIVYRISRLAADQSKLVCHQAAFPHSILIARFIKCSLQFQNHRTCRENGMCYNIPYRMSLCDGTFCTTIPL